MTFLQKVLAAAKTNNSLLCVGLDPDIEKLPMMVRSARAPLFAFNKAIIDTTADVVCAFKPNSAFYEALGDAGVVQLKQTCEYIRATYPHLPILLDYKRGDIGNTNAFYARFAFDYLGVDAITISPYLGKEANQAYLDYTDKGVIVLCRTSNSGAGEFQDLEVDGKKLYQIVAERVMRDWNEQGNCLLVVGSPYPDELALLRRDLGDEAVFLIPGVGTQGGEVEATVRAGVNKRGTGAIINASRAVLFAEPGDTFARAARAEAIRLRDEINTYRGGRDDVR